MSQVNLAEIRNLVDSAINARTKKDALPSIKRLEFIASNIKGSIDPYSSGKLGEVIIYAKQASGKAQNKEHWISVVRQCWFVFESRVSKNLR